LRLFGKTIPKAVVASDGRNTILGVQKAVGAGDEQSTTFRKDRSEAVPAVAAVLPYMYVAIGGSDGGCQTSFRELRDG
jgi:hypothetical protein